MPRRFGPGQRTRGEPSRSSGERHPIRGHRPTSSATILPTGNRRRGRVPFPSEAAPPVFLDDASGVVSTPVSREHPMPVYLKPLAIVVASIVFPPAGLLLLWMRRGTGVLKKALLSVPILALAVAQLFLVYGARLELYGGMTPRVDFERAESRDRAVEESRAVQAQAVPAPAAPAPAVTANRPARTASGRGRTSGRLDVLGRLPRSGAPRALRPDAHSHCMARGGVEAAVGTAVGRRIRVVHRRARRGVHHRAAPRKRGRGRLRPPHRPRALDELLGRVVPRGARWRWPACDAGVGRRAGVRARGDW